MTATTNLPNPPLTLREVADYLSVTEDVARDLLRKEKIHGFKAGGRWRIPPEAVTEFMIEQLSKS
jgi:excisionase family DNA binding protein